MSTDRASLAPRTARRPRRWVRGLLVFLAVVLVAAVVTPYVWARRSLPQITGTLQLQGLQQPVTVYRDEWGVPHIEAKTAHDLYMAQGFVTAQDRLWEMDMTRRAAAGRLSEVLGASYVDTDKFFRTFLLRKSAEQSMPAYSDWAMAALQAYADGVNAFINQAEAGGSLPVEFTLLGYKPEPWTPVDSASIGKYMAYDLNGTWRGIIYRYQLRQTVGDDLAKQLWPVYPKDGVTIIADAGSPTDTPTAVAELPPNTTSPIDVSWLFNNTPPQDEFVGSNNWVVSGKLTKSGKPLLSNDPHLSLMTPAIWYQTHLVLNGDKEKMNTIGVMFPGAPGLVIGHNDKVAWGVTNVGPDAQDVYIEKRNPANPYQFEFQGKWEDATVYKDPIKIKGKPDVPFEVVVTRHGPIISEVVGSKENRPQEALALKWTAHMQTTELEAVMGFDKAQNWNEFREALRSFLVPAQNFVFASVDGTIAYHAGGLVPIRAKGDATLPVPGWTGEYEWTGFIPFDAMPEVVNPDQGFVVTANNKVVSDSYKFHLANAWAQPWRATRITEMIKSKQGLTISDMQQIQNDNMDLEAKTLLPILLPALEKAGLSGAEKGAYDLLKGWNLVDAADQGAPLVYHTWWKYLTQQLYEPKMGKDLFSRMEDQGNVTDVMLQEAAKGNVSDWIKNAGGLEKLAVDSFKAAVAEDVKLQGSTPAKWSWGQFHKVGPAHPIGGAVKPLGWFMNPKQYPIGGSGVTVHAMSFNRTTGQATSGGVWRQTVDLADVAGNSFDVVFPGQSGHFLSPWYQDQAPLHVEGKYHPQKLLPDAYSKGQKLVLKP